LRSASSQPADHINIPHVAQEIDQATEVIGPLQAKFTMRAEANKPQNRLVRLLVDQHQVRPGVAIAEILPVAGQRDVGVPVIDRSPVQSG
jgi:hypothetical protein